MSDLDDRIARTQSRNALLSAFGFLADEQRDELGDLYRERDAEREKDRALAAFLDRENPVTWDVKADGGTFLEVDIWKGDDHDYAGRWQVEVADGSAERIS
jgi:hypothetical protein